MKAYALNLFNLAEQDAEEAERCVATSPNLAVFHAQQCAEKSLKAFCLQLYDVKDGQEENFLRNIGHDSIRAVMKSIGQIITKVFERSGYADLAQKFQNLKTQVEMMASAIYQIFPHLFTGIVQQINDLSILDPEDAWAASFNESLEPKLRVNLTNAEKGSLADTEAFVNLMVGIVGLPPITKTALPSLVTQLDGLAQRSESEGNADQARGFRNAMKEVNRISALLPWLESCCWAPYLDAHVATGRYANPEELKVYESKTAGVKNLVDKSRQIMQKSKDLLVALTTY